jgi:hypothetical protein
VTVRTLEVKECESESDSADKDAAESFENRGWSMKAWRVTNLLY